VSRGHRVISTHRHYFLALAPAKADGAPGMNPIFLSVEKVTEKENQGFITPLFQDPASRQVDAASTITLL
jgi:hypothetical protein